MFPWRLGQFGGAAFLVPYLIFVYVLGTTGLMGEYGLGRWAARGPMGAFDKILGTRGSRFGRLLGVYPVLTMAGVMVFYGVVAGWTLRYLAASVSGAYLRADDTAAYFGQLAGQPASILWQAMTIGLAVGVLTFGISKGIERANKILVPALFVLFLVLLLRVLTLPGAGEGLRYLLVPDWSYLLKPITWGMALGQAFFTVSLSGAGMVVFGSYLRRDADIPASAVRTVTFDTSAALLASLIVVPAAFVYDLDLAAGPPLLFITVPEIFRAMPGGQIFGVLFFLSVFLAAISSLMAMKEVIVEAVIDQSGWRRARSVAAVAGAGFLCGLPLAVNMDLFTRFVNLIAVYLAPAGAVTAAIMFFWVYGVDRARREINVGARRPVGRWWNPVAKYVFVGVASLIVLLQMAFKIG